jgi:hypothetical protein
MNRAKNVAAIASVGLDLRRARALREDVPEEACAS